MFITVDVKRSSSCKCLQRALNQTKWKEYFSGGRKYYYNVSAMLTLLYSQTKRITDRVERVEMGYAR